MEFCGIKREIDRKWLNHARVHANAQSFDRCGGQRSRFLVLTKRSAASGNENGANEKKVQDNLHAHAQNEPIKNFLVPTTPLASMCRAMPFSARALKENIFFDVNIVVKNIKT